jgi:nucleoside-diphosphate-sugar epimerase
MRVVIIGGSGHIGSYLTPRLVESGHHVISVSRSQREPYFRYGPWKHDAHLQVECVDLDRTSSEAAGTFGEEIARLDPDVVMDLICYTLDSAQHLVEALRGRLQHFLHCGTIWVHGPSIEVPVTEQQPRRPFGDYGIRKAAIEAWLLREARLTGFPATVLHPGHLVGPGWVPLNPAANFNPALFADLARGNEITLPNIGRETVHHVHADDVAQSFLKAMDNRANAVGESFHVVSPGALSLLGYAESVAGWYGKEARIRFLPWEEWRSTVSEKEARTTWDHIARSPNCSIAKAQQLLGYQPRYRSLEAIRESVSWLFANGVIEAPAG